MAYVDDKGKRTAPKARPKAKPHSRNAPHNVQTPPGGDIASSGGDYGTRKAKQYSASRASRKDVRETYAEQNPVRRKQISAAVQHRPGPAAAAIRGEHRRRVAADRHAAGTDKPAGNIPGLGQVQQQRRSEAITKLIQNLHNVTPISSTGDTKSDLELATAESYKGTPDYQRKLSSTGQERASREQRKVEVGPAAAIASLPLGKYLNPAIDKSLRSIPNLGAAMATINLSSLASKAVGTDYKPGWKNLPANAVKEALDMPAQSVPSVYHGIIEPLAKGDVKQAAANQIEFPKQLVEHPLRTLQTHPIGTALTIYGPVKGASNLLRAGAVKAGKIPAQRPDAVFPNTPIRVPRETPRGIVGAVAATIKDKPIREGKQPLPLVKTRGKGVNAKANAIQRMAHEDFSATEHIRRIDREVAAAAADDAIGKKPTAAHVLAAQNYVRNIGDVHAYRGRVQDHLTRNQKLLNKLKQEHAPKRDVVNLRSDIKAQQRTLKSLDDFFKTKNPETGHKYSTLPNDANFPKQMVGEVEAYKAVSSHLQENLESQYGQYPRLTMRRLAPYAQKEMGATLVKRGSVDAKTGKVVDPEFVKEVKQELGVDDMTVSATEHQRRLTEFNQRITPVSNVWKGADDKVLTPEAIRAHMAEQEGPFRHPAVSARISQLKGQAKVEQEELDLLERKLQKKYGTTELDPKKLTGMDLKALEKQQGRVARLSEDLKKTKQGIVTQTVALPREQAVKGEPKIKPAAREFKPNSKPFKQLDKKSGKMKTFYEAGRGSLDEHGRLHTWYESEGTHTQRMGDMLKNKNFAPREDFMISPEGTIRIHSGSGKLTDYQIVARAIAQDSRLKPPLEWRLTDSHKIGGGKEAWDAAVAEAEKLYGPSYSQVKIPGLKMETKYPNQGITEPAFISHAKHRSSVASYFVNPNRPQAITPSGFTGKAIEQGLADLGPDVPKQDLVRAQGLVTAAERFKQMIRDVAVRRDPNEPVIEADGTVVHDEQFPQVATYGSKSDAQRVADDLKDKYPDHEVVPVRAALNPQQQREFLNEANDDAQMGVMAEGAIQDALNGKEIQGKGNWVLMPKDYVDEAVKYIGEKKPIRRMIGSQFRKTVLALSIPWLIGNYSEAIIRTALSRVGPRSYYTGRHVLNYLKKNDPAAYHELQARAVGGGHYNLQRSTGIYTGVEHLQASSTGAARALADSITAIHNNKMTGPPVRAAGTVWNHWTDFVFNKVNGRLESQFQTAMMGKAFRETLMDPGLKKLTKQAMNEAVEGKLNLRTMDMLGRKVDEMYGKYSKFGPGLKKAIAHETPFVAWYLNAVRFIYKTMPKDHPVATTLISNAYEASQEWLKDKGLGLFLETHVPDFLQGSIPTDKGNLRFRYTPFSVMGDPLGSAASVFFPQFKSILLNGMGLDWKGDPLKNGDRIEVKTAEALKSLTSALVPGYAIANRAVNIKPDEPPSHHVRRTLGDPFLTSKSPEQLKAASGRAKKSYFGPQGGTSTGSKKKKYFDSSGQTTTKKKKYFSTP